jgi:transcriptional regulator with XRE-family HTH domain
LALVATTGNMLGERLRAAREAADLSLDALSQHAGVPSDQLDEIERRGTLDTSTLDAIALALGRDVHSLLFDGDVHEVLMRAGDADQPAIDEAVGILARFVRDYEFLRSLDA